MAAVKRVLVLGAASGIGHACATALHDAGWHVLGGDMAEIEPGGVVAESAVFDVRDPEAVEAGLAHARPVRRARQRRRPRPRRPARPRSRRRAGTC